MPNFLDLLYVVNIVFATLAFFISIPYLSLKTIEIVVDRVKVTPAILMLWLSDFSIVLFSTIVIYDAGLTVFYGEHNLIAHRLYASLLASLTLLGSLVLRALERQARNK